MYSHETMANISTANVSTDLEIQYETNGYAYPCGNDHYYNCSVFVVCSLIFVAGVTGNCIVIYPRTKSITPILTCESHLFQP